MILGKLRFLLAIIYRGYTKEAAKHNKYYRYFSFSYFLLCSFVALMRKAYRFLHESEEFFTDLSRKLVILSHLMYNKGDTPTRFFHL
jgi:hypothetical protein